MQSNKISQLNSCPFKSKITVKQLEFTVLVLCSARTGSDQYLGAKLKQGLEYCWENVIEGFTLGEDSRKHGQLSKLLCHSYMEALARLCGTERPEVGPAGQEWTVSKASNSVLILQLT